MKINVELTPDQLDLIAKSLDLYVNIGVGRMSVIKDHPSIENLTKNTSVDIVKVGDKAEGGIVTEVGDLLVKIMLDDTKEIKTFTRLRFDEFLRRRSEADYVFNLGKNILCKTDTNSNFSIYDDRVHKSVVNAYDLSKDIKTIIKR